MLRIAQVSGRGWGRGSEREDEDISRSHMVLGLRSHPGGLRAPILKAVGALWKGFR